MNVLLHPCLVAVLLAVPATAQVRLVPQTHLGEEDARLDTDGDGLSDLLEQKLGTDPDVADALVSLVGTVLLPAAGPAAAPAIGAQVWIADSVLPRFRAQTDASGTFQIDGWPAALLPRTLHARHLEPGLGALVAEGQVVSALSAATLQLAPGLRSRVLPLAALPVAGNDVVVADLNGDGFSDVVADEQPRTAPGLDALLVFLSGPGGALQETQSLAVEPTERLKLADLNGDGAPDLIASGPNAADTSLFRGAPDGSFTFVGTLGAPFVDTVVADVDLDGFLDIVGNNGSITVLRGNGEAAFGPPTNGVSVGPMQDLEAADLDLDGDPDLVGCAGIVLPEVYVFPNQAGAFPTATTLSVSRGIQDIELADLDADGRMDIVTSFFVLPGQPGGPGAFGAERTFASSSSSRSTTVVDYDCDGRLDVVRADAVFRQRRPFTFERLPLASPVRGDGVEVGDFDADGRVDVLATGLGATLEFHREGASKHTTQAVSLAERPRVLRAADIDSDGVLDLAVQTDTTIEVFSACDRTRLTSLFRADLPPTAERFGGLELADLDDDGFPDLVTVIVQPGSFPTDGDQVRIWRGSAPGLFDPPVDVATTWDIDGFRLGDIEGDGLLDVLVRFDFQSLIAAEWEVVPIQNDGTPGTPYSAVVPSEPIPDYFLFGDVDGDGLADLIAPTGFSSPIHVYAGAGDGTFTLRQALPDSWSRTGFLADIESDGISDVILHDSLGGANSLLRYAIEPDGTLVLADSFSALFPQALADVDGEGTLDLITADQIAFGVDPTQVERFEDLAESTVVAADFDDDGIPDLAAARLTPAGLRITYGAVP